MKPLIAIAISGGIDSLMAAYLLKEQGHGIIGIHFITGYEVQPSVLKKNPGFVKTDTQLYADVKARAAHKIAPIASQLGIDIRLLECSIDFKQTVIDYFTLTYQNGQTPNPCMVCNRSIKFGTILSFARKLGASFLATGHYARIRRDRNGRFQLLKGVDSKKDLLSFKCNTVNINWIHQKPALPMKVHTRVRYRHKAAASTLIPTGAHTAVVRFDTPQSAIAPGQCAVFFKDDEVLGGGWIDKNA